MEASKFKNFGSLVLGFLFSILASVWLYQFCFGLARANPLFIEWQFRVDPGAHFFAWQLFRNDPWSFPVIGKITSYGYPRGSTVGLSDSIPLLAFVFKLVRSFLPENFQYFGAFILFNFVLQAASSFYLGLKIFSKKFPAFLFSILFITAPVFLFRISEHAALTTQWPLILGLALTTQPKNENRLTWYTLFFFSAFIHPYLWVMLLIEFLLHEWLLEKSPLTIFRNCAPIILASAFIWFLSGSLGSGGVMGEGLKRYNSNLNALFNSYGYSSLFPILGSTHSSHYEGFGYLGLGGIFLLALGFYNNLPPKKVRWFLAISFLLAVSVIFQLNDWFTIDLFKFFRLFGVTQLLSIFRCCGRFIWLTWYGLITWAAIGFAKKFSAKPLLLGAILTLIAALQVYDLIPLFQHENQMSRDQSQYVMGDELKVFAPLASGKTHLFIFPGIYELRWLKFASDHHLSTNFKLEGRDDQKLEPLNQDYWKALQVGDAAHLDAQSIYVIRNDLLKELGQEALSKIRTQSSFENFSVVTF